MAQKSAADDVSAPITEQEITEDVYAKLNPSHRTCAKWCGGTDSFAQQYAVPRMLFWSSLIWLCLGVLFYLLCIAYYVVALADPSDCRPGVIKLYPCAQDLTSESGIFGPHTVAAGHIETVLCGETCSDCFEEVPSEGDAWPDTRSAAFPEAYFVQLQVRSAYELSRSCGTDMSEWACVEVCKASTANPEDEGYELHPCEGCRNDGMWVSTKEADCVVLGGRTGSEARCSGSTANADYDAKCASNGPPFAGDVGDWLRWDNQLGYTWGLYEAGCIAADDGDCGCGDGRKGCSCGGGKEPPAPDPEPDPEPEPSPEPSPAPSPAPGGAMYRYSANGDYFDDREDMVPQGVDEDDVNWVMLPPGNYEHMRKLPHPGTTAALVVTDVHGVRHATPYAQSFNGLPLP